MFYSKSGNILHCKNRDGEWWRECDESGKCIHSISRLDWLGYASNIEEWHEYDAAGNEVHYKDNDGHEQWYEYDADGKVVHYKNSDGVEGRYDKEKNKLYFKFGANEEWREYDAERNEVLCFAKKNQIW